MPFWKAGQQFVKIMDREVAGEHRADRALQQLGEHLVFAGIAHGLDFDLTGGRGRQGFQIADARRGLLFAQVARRA